VRSKVPAHGKHTRLLKKEKGDMNIKMWIARHGMGAYIFLGKLSKGEGTK
jgi:hypothetical protein